MTRRVVRESVCVCVGVGWEARRRGEKKQAPASIFSGSIKCLVTERM